MNIPVLMYIAIVSAACILPAMAEPLIIDHTYVNFYTNLTPADIARVKTLWVSLAGESHSRGYRFGCQLLENIDSRCQMDAQDGGTPEAYTTNHLRISPTTWGDSTHASGWTWGYGEADWYASANAINATKAGLSYCATNGPQLDVLGFGWCWDMSWHNGVGGGTNTTYGTRWAGASEGGPDGDRRWGLTAADYPLTGNRVCMDTYINATEQYRGYCRTNGYATKVIFTTGPVDGSSNDERSYQVWVKHQYIRNYVRSNTTHGILFDYADILCWDNAGTQNTETWRDWNGVLRTFPVIAADNMLDLNGSYAEDGDHIGQRGALRLAKALWWMLAAITEPPSSLSILKTNDSLVISFTGVPWKSYQIQYNEHLTSSTWSEPSNHVADEYGRFQFTNSLAPNRQKFFRVL